MGESTVELHPYRSHEFRIILKLFDPSFRNMQIYGELLG